MTIAAKFENGVFRPLEENVKEGTVVQVHVPVEQHAAHIRPSVKDLSFYGIWEGRPDMRDGVDFVDKLRDNPRG
jgi:predicted DNA-binding antitoxin AbrB/MazE fold protein